jgi:hypothetical protein
MRTAFTGSHTGPRQLELPPNMPVFEVRRQVVHPVLLAAHPEDVRVPLVELRDRADAVGAQELVLVEHLREEAGLNRSDRRASRYR